jgi:hypothetical protein
MYDKNSIEFENQIPIPAGVSEIKFYYFTTGEFDYRIYQPIFFDFLR